MKWNEMNSCLLLKILEIRGSDSDLGVDIRGRMAPPITFLKSVTASDGLITTDEARGQAAAALNARLPGQCSPQLSVSFISHFSCRRLPINGLSSVSSHVLPDLAPFLIGTAFLHSTCIRSSLVNCPRCTIGTLYHDVTRRLTSNPCGLTVEPLTPSQL